ncbi:MAG TPA: metal ABC transporter ATP-binding protein [Acidimicrobiales bacterium]|nr:metal ABC transporter ATP-binding protein [Acidimicrobiales bacterium]
MTGATIGTVLIPDSSSPVLEVDAVSFAYGRQPVLDCVSLAVGRGEFVALVGPNGSGKSTLLRIVLGLTPAQQGEVRLFGTSPSGLDDRWRVGYVPQRAMVPELLPVTVAEVVASGRLSRRGWVSRLGRQDHEEVDHALTSVGLMELAGTKLSELSGGQQQRAFIARALVNGPDLLVLDEPVAGVDAESQENFRASLVHMVREHGAAVLLVSHELGAVADDLDRLLVLRRGKIVFDGAPADLTASGVSLGVHREDLPVWLEGLG